MEEEEEREEDLEESHIENVIFPSWGQISQTGRGEEIKQKSEIEFLIGIWLRGEWRVESEDSGESK